MKRTGMMSALVLACLAGTGLWVYRSQAVGANAVHSVGLKVTPENVEVKRGESDTEYVSVELHNPGPRAIHIDKVETSCHCTSVDTLNQMDLAPGQTTTLNLKLQLPGVGKQETSVTIYSNSVTTPKVRIPVKMQGAEIFPPYFLTNSEEVRHQMTSGDDRRVQFEVSAVESPGEPWITGFDSNNNAFSVVSCESAITTQYDEKSLHRTYTCTLEVSRFTPGETLRGSLRSKCRTESMKPLPILSVTITSVATAKAIPAQLFITQKSRQALPISKTIVIETAASNANPVREVSASVDWITIARLSSSETHPVYRMTITPPVDLPSNLSPQIVFHFADVSIPPMSVPLVFE